MFSQLSQSFQGQEHSSFQWRGGNWSALLIHGFPGTPAEMHPIAMQLHEHQWTVRAPLLPGFGSDIQNLPEKNCHHWVGEITENLGELRKNHDHIILIGNSMGAALALQTASKENLDALILLAPFWKVNHILWKFVPILRYLIPTFKPFKFTPIDFSDPVTRKGIKSFVPEFDIDDPEIQQTIRDLSIPTHIINQIRIVGAQGYKATKHITCPTLVIQGKQDELVLPRTTRRLLQQFSGSVHYHEIDATHNLIEPFTPSCQVVQDLIGEFLIQNKLGKCE